MKKYYGIILLACLAFYLQSFINNKSEKFESVSQYKVIKVSGKIIYIKTGTDMKMGDTYLNGTPIEFKTDESRAAIVSNTSGRFILQPTTKGKPKVIPAASNVTSRAGALINLIDLQNYFSGRYLIFDSEKLLIGQEAFPMNENAFFYIKYNYNNESIAKKLEYLDNHLIIDKKELFKIDGKEIDIQEKEMTLYYRNEGKSFIISQFTPVFPDLKILKEEIDVLLSNLSDKNNEDKLSEITAYLNEFYIKMLNLNN